MADLPDSNSRLDFSIHSVSSYSAAYAPSNIIIDNPGDQSSRWSGANTYSSPAQARDGPGIGTRERQWVCLKLERPAIVRRITFGKYMKPHPCNLREFKVYGGQSPNSAQMTLLHHGGLKNDNIPETFELRCRNDDGVVFPCDYIRIEPLVAHSQNYNVSIWHVALAGIIESPLIDIVARDYEQFRETKTLRLMLKHLRQRGMHDAFESVRAHVCAPPLNVSLEHPLLSQLYDAFVLRGDFNTTEALLSRAAFTPFAALSTGDESAVPASASGPTLFSRFIQQTPPRVSWERLDTNLGTADVNGDAPGPRGGHQLVFSAAIPESDAFAGQPACIYLLGGWNGTEDLADFWRFDLPAFGLPPDPRNRGRWTMLSRDTAAEGGPGGRSCHKACLDEKTGDIYVLGHFLEAHVLERDGMGTMASDFYRFSTRGSRAGLWEVLSVDTAKEGGPSLVYDHQMLVDSERRMIYAFGGKLVQPESAESQYSGLFAYSISERKWSHLLNDPAPGEPQSTRILSRIGHSMLFDPRQACLFIFAGQRNETYLSDLWSYNLVTGEMRCITEDYHAEGGPQGGFTQRATIDVDLGEWHMLSGLMMDRANRLKGVQNSLWIRRTENNSWIQIEASDDGPGEEPKPRFAHQMVYDPQAKVHYLFGGNPAEAEANVRLGDFWRLELIRLTPAEVLRKARFLLRRQRFIEMCQSDSPMSALLYLQNSVASVTDHSEESEAATFRACMSHLLAAPASRTESAAASPAASGVLPPRPLNALQLMDEDETDAVMASSQDFAPVGKTLFPLDTGVREDRHKVFEELLRFFRASLLLLYDVKSRRDPPAAPEHREPSEDLIDVAR